MVIRRWDRLPATSGTPALLKTIGILVSNTALRPAMEATKKNTKKLQPPFQVCSYQSQLVTSKFNHSSTWSILIHGAYPNLKSTSRYLSTKEMDLSLVHTFFFQKTTIRVDGIIRYKHHLNSSILRLQFPLSHLFQHPATAAVWGGADIFHLRLQT